MNVKFKYSEDPFLIKGHVECFMIKNLLDHTGRNSFGPSPNSPSSNMTDVKVDDIKVTGAKVVRSRSM